MQSAEHRQIGPLEAEELDRARQNWVKNTQQEIANLQLISTNYQDLMSSPCATNSTVS